MSSNYSANQYDGVFKPQRLQNWCEPKLLKKEQPSARVGHTSFIADSRGHLLPGVKRGSAWSDFTARSVGGLDRLKSCPPQRGKPLSNGGSRNTDVGKQTSKDVHQSVADTSTGAEAHPESQKGPFTGSESHSSSQRHEAGSPAEQALQATSKDEPNVCN